MAEQNLLLHLESDEVFAGVHETRQHSVADTFESRPPMELVQQTSLSPATKLYDESQSGEGKKSDGAIAITMRDNTGADIFIDNYLS